MAIKLIIPGRPVPYVRMTQRGKYVKRNAQRYMAYKDSIKYIALNQIKGEIATENMKVIVKVYLKGKTTPMGNDGDIDNYIKSALDSLNGIAYKDDRQVVKVYGEKQPCKANEERMEIEISKIQGGH